MTEPEDRSTIRRGRCHLVGDNVSLDDGIIPRRFASQRVTAAAELIPYLFESVDPALAQRIRKGDIILAGRNFCCGKPRVQGFIALAELDLAVICASMPYKMLRRAVARGIPVIVGGPDPEELAGNADEVEIDFATGTIWNLTRDSRKTLPPMAEILREIVGRGGMQAMLRDWLIQHPEQAHALDERAHGLLS